MSHSFLDYVSEIFSILTCAKPKELAVLEEELKKDVPDPLHTMLENKQERDNAIEKFISRKGKTTAIVPATCTGMLPFNWQYTQLYYLICLLPDYFIQSSTRLFYCDIYSNTRPFCLSRGKCCHSIN